jgi:hypothetical protein
MELTGSQTAGEGAAGHHAFAGLMDDDDGWGPQQCAVAAAGLVPFKGHEVVLPMAAGKRTGEAHQEIAMVRMLWFADHGEVLGLPCKLLKTGVGIGTRVSARRKGIPRTEGVAWPDVGGRIRRGRVCREHEYSGECGGETQLHEKTLPQSRRGGHGFSNDVPGGIMAGKRGAGATQTGPH